MTTPRSRRSFAPRVAAVGTGALGLLATSVILAGPAAAGVPEGWAEENEWSLGGLLAVVIAVPVIVGIVISLLVLLPGVMRGEGLIPKAPREDSELPAGSGESRRAIGSH